MLIEPGTGKSAAPIERAHLTMRIVAAFWTAVFFAPWLVYAIQSPATGWDFPVFYIAGKLPLKLLYNREAFFEYWKLHLQPLGSLHWAAYVRPSVFSLLLRPIAAVPYVPAMWAWMAAGFAAYLLSAILLIRRFQLPLLLLPAFVCFFPAMRGMIGGGDTTFVLLAIVLGLLLLEKNYDSLAAACFVLCLSKFNLVLLVPAMLLLHRRFKALTVFTIGALLVAGLSLSLTSLHDYQKAIADAQEQTLGFFPVGLRGATSSLGIGWAYLILAAVTAAICLWLMPHLPTAEALSVALTGSLMISPYVCWYDSTLLALVLVVLWARSGKAMRRACVMVLIAVPLWPLGGGFMHRPGGYMHVLVEAAVIIYYVNAVWTHALRRDLSRFHEALATITFLPSGVRKYP
jgi:hypothetical protein